MIYLFTYLKITVLSTKYMVINNKQMSRCIISLNISDLLTNFNTSYISWFTTLSLKTDLKSIVYSCIWLTVWTRIKWSTVKSKLDFPRCGTSSTYILQKRKKEKISSYSTITYRIFFYIAVDQRPLISMIRIQLPNKHLSLTTWPLYSSTRTSRYHTSEINILFETFQPNRTPYNLNHIIRLYIGIYHRQTVPLTIVPLSIVPIVIRQRTSNDFFKIWSRDMQRISLFTFISSVPTRVL